MRRFNKLAIGKGLGRLAIAAFLVPILSIMSAKPAEAQLQMSQSWGVLDFTNRTNRGPANLGVTASEAFRSELGKTGKYEVISVETINRAMTALNLQPPVTQTISLVRLGQELGAANIVTGEVVNWRIVEDGRGKRADVILKITVTDVASGLAVNGAAFAASSTVRPSETSEEVLLSDALSIGATQGVSEIFSKELPRGTILNTTTEQALVNQGSRSGFAAGQDVIILRGREQVGIGRVIEVEPENSTIKLVRTSKGLSPGDRVRVIFTPSKISDNFSGSGGVQVAKQRPRSPNSGLLTVAAVLGIALVLLGSGRASNTALVTELVTEATSDLGGGAVKLSWTPDILTKGNETREEWQVWRDDVTTSPVLVVPGGQIWATDTSVARDVDYQNIATIGGRSCDVTDRETETAEAVAGVTSGRPYRYRVSLIYKLMAIDVPGAAEDATYCYFSSSRVGDKGYATPFTPVTTVSPVAGGTISNPASVNFTFQAAPTLAGVTCEYILQISDSLTFQNRRTLATLQDNRLNPATITVESIPLINPFGDARRLFWRVGVRNPADKPGPKPDQFSKERYIFSAGSEFFLP